jgi:hypothetical protein
MYTDENASDPAMTRIFSTNDAAARFIIIGPARRSS